MPQAPEPIRRFYADWTQYRSRLVDGVRDLTADQLAIRAGPEHAPIWALAAHCAGVRTSKDGTGLAYERLGEGPHVGQGLDAGPGALAAATKAFLT